MKRPFKHMEPVEPDLWLDPAEQVQGTDWCSATLEVVLLIFKLLFMTAIVIFGAIAGIGKR